MMRKLEAYFGMRVVTYCVMSNHYHVLVEEPDSESVASLDADEILRRIKLLKDATALKTVKQELERARDKGDSKWEEEILNRYRRRMGDVSVFMQELKQRFSQWYNKRNSRKGTLWEGRFKSVLVEGDDQALMTMAAYILT
jgi:putative transposase